MSPGQDENSRADVAKGEAQQVGQEGAAAGRHVADTAKGEARNVAEEAKGQAQSLMHTLQHDLNEQAGTQQKRAAEGLKSVSEELRSMADNSEQNGIATQWVQEAASRLGSVAGWLDDRDPSSVLEETKRFARNRPGTFLAIAAGAGLVAGRLARSLKENSSGSGSSSSSNSSTGSPSSGAGAPVSSPPSVPPQAGDYRRDPLEGGVPATGAPETRTAPGYPSQPPAYPTSSPSAAPSRVDPTFPDDGARGLN
ncbi:hypothetical protein [Brevibacterium sp.]|uniref:hypothetical protein n=1 Tax=Brevibacterium sp. TaxID=1701 RepID=UPI0028110204|nr:hypothetical protein [Brevibacterium sp.]